MQGLDKNPIIEKKWYHALVINPYSSNLIGYWYTIINVCYLYGFYRDPYYISFHIARNGVPNDNFTPRQHGAMGKEIVIDIVLALNIVVTALTTYRKSDASLEMNPINLVIHYLINGSMITDCLAVFPTLATQSGKSMYLFKLLRFLKLG